MYEYHTNLPIVFIRLRIFGTNSYIRNQRYGEDIPNRTSEKETEIFHADSAAVFSLRPAPSVYARL